MKIQLQQVCQPKSSWPICTASQHDGRINLQWSM